jgi:hypothetical protein
LAPFDAWTHVIGVKRVKHVFDPAFYLRLRHLSRGVLGARPIVNVARAALVVGTVRVKARALAKVFFVCHRGVSSLVDVLTMPTHPRNVNNYFMSCENQASQWSLDAGKWMCYGICRSKQTAAVFRGAIFGVLVGYDVGQCRAGPKTICHAMMGIMGYLSS